MKLGLVGLFALVTGCTASVPPPPLPVASDFDQAPIVRDRDPEATNEDVPKSIRRLVAEERVKLQDCVRMSAILSQDSGRDRARTIAFQLTRDLNDIEASLDSADSDRLDSLVISLRRLATKIQLFHETLEANI